MKFPRPVSRLFRSLLGPRWTAHFYYRDGLHGNNGGSIVFRLSFRSKDIQKAEKRILKWRDNKMKKNRLTARRVLVTVFDENNPCLPVFIS